eukprot:14312234-Ditylum_brightwellii.AAC.1
MVVTATGMTGTWDLVFGCVSPLLQLLLVQTSHPNCIQPPQPLFPLLEWHTAPTPHGKYSSDIALSTPPAVNIHSSTNAPNTKVPL